MQPGARRVVEFVRRHIIAQLVAAIVGEPKFTCHRMPVKPDAVAHAVGEHNRLRAIGPHAENRPIARVAALTHITRRADRHIEPAVRTKANELPAVMAVARQAVGHHHGLGRVIEPGFDLIIAQNAIDFGHV